MDNVEHVSTVSKILPERGNGHIIMTTRAQSVGTVASKIEVEVMNDAEGCLFLLHRSKRLALDLPLARATEEDRSLASQLVSLMDGLPLALDQAGAYLEETQCSLAQYLDLYQQYHAQLLDRRGKTASDHPDSVATTFLISFDHIKRHRPDVAALLRFCAFLPPDAIFADAISAGAPDLGPLLGPVAADPVRLLDAIGELLAYSFLRRALSDTAWRMHRLLQVVLKDAMQPQTERKWARRVVQMTERIFLPPDANPTTLRHYEPYLPYVQVCADLIKRWAIFTAPATVLLLWGGLTFRELGLYSQAEPLYKHVAELFTLLLDPESRTTAHFLMQAGHLYMDLGRYDVAQQTYLWALKTFEEARATTPAELIEILSYVAVVFLKRQQFQKAYGYCQRIVTIQDDTRAPFTSAIARCFSASGHIAEARQDLNACARFHRQAKDLREQLLGPEHPEVAESFNDLTANALMRGDLAGARNFSRRALAISQKARGPDHPTTAHYLDARAIVYREEGNYEQAEKLHLRARYLLSQKLEPDHLALIQNHHYLSVLYRKWEKDEKADREERRRDRLYAQHRELTPQEMLMSIERLAATWREQGKDKGADRLLALAAFLRKHLF
jgi:tetratricopeptide (TPR) repeat protein